MCSCIANTRAEYVIDESCPGRLMDKTLALRRLEIRDQYSAGALCSCVELPGVERRRR